MMTEKEKEPNSQRFNLRLSLKPLVAFSTEENPVTKESSFIEP